MVPNGVALPLSFYAQFMTASGLYEKVRQLQDRLRTMEDPQTQQQALNALCQKIEDPEIPLYSQNSWQRLRPNFATERWSGENRLVSGRSVRGAIETASDIVLEVLSL